MAPRPAPRAKAPPAPAATVRPARAPRDGAELARWLYERDTGRDALATMEMVLVSRSGHRRVRRFESRMRRHEGLQDSLIRFTYPADIEGTAFLTVERRGRDPEQFLYLPALRRVRRIVAKQKGKSFVNSDLYYQDLERRRPEKDRHRLLGEATVAGHRCWILESTPKERTSSAYGKTVAWIDQESLLPLKAEFYDRKLRLLKRSRTREIERIQGIWTAMESEVTTVKRRHTTRLKVLKIRYNVGLRAADFDKRALRR
ncbi:MAG: outer membrane lipoprotein-sorting protein [Nitrospirae bacterium]|nr:MAG: outer membrane lipoprotein-sorting protein [Nitrospirota bacterium]